MALPSATRREISTPGTIDSNQDKPFWQGAISKPNGEPVPGSGLPRRLAFRDGGLT